MPGLFGYTKDKSLNVKLEKKHQLNIVAQPKVHFRKDYENKAFFNSFVGFDYQINYPYHFEDENFQVWVYGDPLIDGLTGENAFQQVIIRVLENYPDFSSVANIDGVFTILLQDKKNEKLFFIGDRNGLCHFYYGVFNSQLIWANELRGFKELELAIEKDNVYDYLNLGYLINNDTWFREIHLLSPASFLEWDIKLSKIKSIKTYWSHKNLIKNAIDKPEKEIINDLKNLFEQAVLKRISKNERVGITLSGGLDSRLIFANIPKREKTFTVITRGMDNAGDVVLAKRVVSRRKDCNHIIKEMDASSWTEGRKKAVIATSGQKTFFDMSAISSLSIHKEYFDINLDGAGGDGIFAGGHLKYEDSNDLKSNFKRTYFKSQFLHVDKTIEKFIKYYEKIGSDHFFYLYERVRKFTVFGSILGYDYGIMTRFPFLDNNLQDYFYQLDESLDSSKIYRKMLIKYFPEYFVEIDCLDTGARLYSNGKIYFIVKAWNRALEKIGIKKYSRKYHDYPKWIRKNDEGLIRDYILNEELYIYRYIDYNKSKEMVDVFYKTGEHSKFISRILSLSIFLENYYFHKN